MAETIKVDLDPKKVVQSLRDMSEETKKLAKIMEDSLGKDSVTSVNKMVEATEDGTSKMSTYFKNLGTRIKDDLKTAFDVSGVIAGGKFLNEVGQGVKSVFDMERAFDKLQTRLQMTTKEFLNFRNNLGRGVAATGQKLEDILPGVETFAAKGGVKSGTQLTNIGEQLAKVKSATGEDVTGLSDQVVQILRNQGKMVNDKNTKDLLDAIQGTRTAGAFKTAGGAADAIERISAIRGTKLSTREMGGMAAQASLGGDKGVQLLESILQKGQTVGGQQTLNALFKSLGGAEIFKGGKLNAEALSKVNFKGQGGIAGQQLGALTGIGDVTGSELDQFVKSFQTGNEGLQKVLKGSDETATQFGIATDNIASKLDKFKQSAINAGREIGEGLSRAANELLKGNFKEAGGALQSAGKSAYENKGTMAAAAGSTILAGLLVGGGLTNILKKIPGAGSLAGGLVGGEIAKQAGVTPVYVVNAKDIGGSGNGVLDIAAKSGGAFSQIGKFGLYGAAIGGGVYAGNKLNESLQGTKLQENVIGPFFEKLASLFSSRPEFVTGQGPNAMTADEIYEAMQKGAKDGIKDAKIQIKHDGPLTNPSAVTGRGAPR